MEGKRVAAYITFEPGDRNALRALPRTQRLDFLRSTTAARARDLLAALESQGLGSDIDVVNESASQGVPAGTVLVNATERALEAACAVDGVAAVAYADTQLPIEPRSA
jgi:formylmethanofuran:tetrahydromethanopterin formyltransferase